MNKEEFMRARLAVENSRNNEKLASIGVLGEKSIHATIKHYLESNIENHEVRVGGYIADIRRGNKIIEIQSRDFSRLREKVNSYLRSGFKVEIVLPVVTEYNLNWVDGETGCVIGCSKKTKMHSRKGVLELLYEIYGLCSVDHNLLNVLDFRVIGVQTEDYRIVRFRNGNKRRGERVDRIPTDITKEIEIKHNCTKSMLQLVSKESLSKELFNSLEFAKDNKVKRDVAQRALLVLRWMGIVRQVDRTKDGIVYEWVRGI